jgi:hypothetical protein
VRPGPIVAAFLWTAVVLTWALFFNGQVYMCLGPLNVTEESCRAASGLPPLTDRDRFLRGWGLVAILLAGGWAAIAVIARWRRQRGGL